MKLNLNSIQNNSQEWLEKGYLLPSFDIQKVAQDTRRSPEWIHFGAGNIFRAFLASAQQELLNAGAESKGIVVAEGYDYEIIDKAYRPYDQLCLSVTLCAAGTIEKNVVASVCESLRMNPEEEDYQRLKEIFREPVLKMASFTITEKGYKLKGQDGTLFPMVEADFSSGPEKASSYLGKVAALLYTRYLAGKLPIAMVSMDNCSHNGSRLCEAITAFAEAWCARGSAEEGFLAYVKDAALVSFPWTMIDKITPRPDAKVVEMLQADGFEDAVSVKTEKGTFVAPFVNAEETQYLMMQDWFPNGKIALDRVRGIHYTDRETVEKIERMKVCTCLNPLHTCLAVYGCLLGYTLISAEMKDPQLKKMVERIGYQEGLPVVSNPGIINPREFLDTCLQVRFPNVFMPDTPQRIATDTSQKLAIRYGETIKAYAADPTLDPRSLEMIPLVFAGWLRYLLGVDDEGKPFVLSDDPILEEMQKALKGISLGCGKVPSEKLRPILSNRNIFGVDLYEVGLAEKVENDFTELIAGPGAVRATLLAHVG